MLKDVFKVPKACRMGLPQSYTERLLVESLMWLPVVLGVRRIILGGLERGATPALNPLGRRWEVMSFTQLVICE